MTTLGAIRWDVGGYGSNSTHEAENNTLRNPIFHDRAPFYATVENTNSLRIVATQGTMDQEIAFALQGGLSYWAFLRYINLGSSLSNDTGLALYQSSASRGALRWCSMEQVGTFGGTSTYPALIGRLVTEMQQSHYQKVLTNRPLMYIWYEPTALTDWFAGSTTTFRAALDALRAAAVAAGLGDPYIVLLMFDPTAESKALADTLGCDALSTYVTYRPSALNAPYPALASTAEAFWATQAATGAKIVPCCMTGWNPQPRMVRPVPWGVPRQRPWVGLGQSVVPATDAQLAAHIAAGRAYVEANPVICDADTFIAYSWNEFGEGHRPLCPTRGNPTGTHLPLIAAAMA